MMYSKKIYKDHWFYGFLRIWVGNAFYGYFSKIEVNGYENLPKDQPVILTPNHENGLVDALLVILASGKQPYSVARAGAFQNPTVHNILTFIKMFPAYRPRDGRENMHKNDEVFEQCADVLLSKKYLLMFPEGDQNMQRRLRPLKKGVFRIAFNAEQQADFNLGLSVIPVGIVYEDHFKIRRRVIVNFGKPISVDRLKGEFEQNNARALNIIKDETHAGMEPLMMNIREVEYYGEVEFLRALMTPLIIRKKGKDPRRYTNHFDEGRLLVDSLHGEGGRTPLLEKVLPAIVQLKELSTQLGIEPADMSYNRGMGALMSRLFLHVLLLPIFVLGFALNFIPFVIPPYIAASKIRNPHFDATFRFGLSLLTFPLYYALLWIVWGVLLNSALYGFIALAISSALGVVAMEYLLEIKRLFSMMKLSFAPRNIRSRIRRDISHLEDVLIQ